MLKIKQKAGYNFEIAIRNFLKKTKNVIYSENEIRNIYGNIFFGIDHMIVSEQIVCIQDKYRDDKPPLSDINHFIKACERISQVENKHVLGIYLSKTNLTKTSLEAFEFENKNNNSCNFVDICNADIDYIYKMLSRVLHYNQIFLYENDGTAIMID